MKKGLKIAIGGDHAGFEYKQAIIDFILSGISNEEDVDQLTEEHITKSLKITGDTIRLCGSLQAIKRQAAEELVKQCLADHIDDLKKVNASPEGITQKYILTKSYMTASEVKIFHKLRGVQRELIPVIKGILKK